MLGRLTATAMSRRSALIVLTATLAGCSQGRVSGSTSSTDPVGTAPSPGKATEEPTVQALQQTLVEGMALKTVNQWLEYWRMERTLYPVDDFHSKTPLPVGTRSIF